MTSLLAPLQGTEFATRFDLSGSNLIGFNGAQTIFSSISYKTTRNGNFCSIQFAPASGTITTTVNDIGIAVPGSSQNWLVNYQMAPPTIRTATPVVVGVAGVNEVAVCVFLSTVIPTFVLRRLNGALWPLGAITLPEGITINWII